jgi:hypothetical protein
MKKYYFLGGFAAFAVIFNLGYAFHEILMGDFFREQIGAIQREAYIIPLIAIAFVFYVAFQAYFLPIYFEYTSKNYRWSLNKTAVVFGAMVGFFWDGLQGGMIEVATFRMPAMVFWYDSSYHMFEGVVTALILAFFYKKFNSPAHGHRGALYVKH